MRLAVRFVRVLALVLLPTLAFAQATITGTVRDTSGAVLPGVTVEASSPALIEKVRTVVSDGTGQYPYRRPPARRLLGHRDAARLQHLQARRDRAGRQLHGADQRRAARGRSRGNRHRDRRDANRGRAERPAPDRHRRRRDQGPAGRALLRRHHDADSGHHHPGRRQPRYSGHSRHAGLRRRRRAQQRSAHPGGRPQHRRGVQRRRRVELHARHQQRPGNRHHHVRRPRRSRSGRPVVQHRAQDRRQPAGGQLLRVHHHRGHGRRQLQPRS